MSNEESIVKDWGLQPQCRGPLPDWNPPLTAVQQVIVGMQACLPEGCPLPFIRVESATFTNRQRRVVLAQVRMFDGLSGTLQVTRVSFSGVFSTWRLHWQELPGGAINWNGTCWERCSLERRQERE